MRAVVLKNHQLRCSAVVVGPPGSVSKTTSGKVQRSRCRARWLDGSLEAQALLVERFEDEEPMDAGSAEAREGEVGASGRMMAPIARNEAQTTDELLAMVRGQVAAVFGIGVANVDIDQPLGAQGLNSVGFVMLASRLSQVVGREVPPMEVFNHPSVRGLATMLSDGEGAILDSGCRGTSSSIVSHRGSAWLRIRLKH
ncbi:phosphopantetheine attachment site family protein [Mycobacterium kansasii]|uniref:Phosphopantetheine attachment site family protein n=1 Tax=Mycobacterium kansasii TaxID=1768 RepID=A0A1V3WP73_MYCKA|nr:phosphopantetheine attachment site family protein [Mycobacterium kansasii]